MRTHLFAVLLFPAFAAAQPAKVEPKPERVTYRLIGLFSPDREKDLRAAFEELPEFKLAAVSFDEAEVTVEFTPAKLFPNQKPERVTELVNEKLRGVTRGTFGVKPRRTVPRDKLEQVVFPVAGLDCKACCLAAYEAVAAIDGVEQATASFKEGRVTALIDPAKTSKEKLEEALKKKGVDLGKAKP
ncbi:MAG: cation transporter [Gemmata sp.]